MTKRTMPDDVVVGANLRTIRLHRKITQADLGLSIGVTPQQLQKYEAGTNRIGPGRLAMVCKVLNCTITDLFQGTSVIDGAAPTEAFPSFSKQALMAAELIDQIEDNTARTSLLKVMKALVGKQGER